MILIAWIVFGFALLQFFVALVNLLFIQKFDTKRFSTNLKVSVLIPARNEEKNISNILGDLLKQNYRNIEIIVFNDQSGDRTSEIVTEIARQDSRIKLIQSTGLPSDWLGKNYACYSMAKQANGVYFLFLDADVRIENDIIGQVVSFSEKYKLGLVSIFPTQVFVSAGEKVTVPLMNFILLTLLPLILVRKSRYSSLAAANGQFMLFNSAIYKETEPHEKMKLNKVEDIEIARYYKKKKIKTACLSGKSEIKCRMYSGFADSVNGFTKNIFNFFGNSPVLSVIFWLSTTFGFIPFLFIERIEFLILYLATILLTRILVAIVSRQSIFENILFMIPHQFVMGLIIFKAFKNRKKKQFIWKGRNISS